MPGVIGMEVAATIFDMAILAGISIEKWAQAIPDGGAGWRDHPGVAEETVAYVEIQFLGQRHMSIWLGVGIAFTGLQRKSETQGKGKH